MNSTIPTNVNLTFSEQCNNVLKKLGQVHTTELSSKIAVGVVIAALTIVTIGGNMVVFVALTLGRGRPSTSSLSMTLTLSLLTADLLLSVGVMPLAAYITLGDSWVLGKVVCR